MVALENERKQYGNETRGYNVLFALKGNHETIRALGNRAIAFRPFGTIG